jgi:hypothetical protein
VADAATEAVRRLDSELKIWEGVGWVLRSEGTDPEPFIRAAAAERDFCAALRIRAERSVPVRPAS